MYLPAAFLMKDFLFLAASFYLLKQDLTRRALDEGAELISAAGTRARESSRSDVTATHGLKVIAEARGEAS
jgi:hypothetical protein